MKLEIGRQAGGFGLKTLFLIGMVGLAALAYYSADDLKRYLRMRSM